MSPLTVSPLTAVLSGADLDLREPNDRSRADDVAHRLLVVLRERLIEEDELLEEAVEATFDDLRDRLFGLALVAGDRLERRALLGDVVGGHLVTREVLRPGERDVDRDVVRDLLRGARGLDEHAIHAALALDVQIAVEDVARALHELDDAT